VRDKKINVQEPAERVVMGQASRFLRVRVIQKNQLPRYPARVMTTGTPKKTVSSMHMPDIAFQKLREQGVAEAFIKEYNRKHKTDYSVDRQYNEEFPDIKFKSASNNSELAAEVVQVVESESEKATESSVVCLQTGIKAELENRGGAESSSQFYMKPYLFPLRSKLGSILSLAMYRIKEMTSNKASSNLIVRPIAEAFGTWPT
jgi:hypothetical protein